MPFINSVRSSYGPQSKVSPEIIKNSLQLYLDAGKSNSYPGTGSTWFDISGNSRNANIFGENVWSSSFRGLFDFVDIAQTSNYISLPVSALKTISGDYTIQTWMRPIATLGTRYFHSVANLITDNLLLLAQDGSALTIYSWNDPAAGSISYSNNEIFLFTIVKTSTSTLFYKNQNLQFSSSVIVNVQNAENGGWILNQEQDSVGGGFSSEQNYRGSFISVMLYSRALSQSEISYNFSVSRSIYGI